MPRGRTSKGSDLRSVPGADSRGFDRAVSEPLADVELIREGVLPSDGVHRDVPGSGAVQRDGYSDLATARKLRRFERTLELAHRCVREFSDERAAVQWHDGFDTEYLIDWRGIARGLLPDVVLVLRTDPARKNFNEHPWRVIVPSLGLLLDCTQAGWLDGLAEPDPIEQRDEVSDALKVLFRATSDLSPETKVNAQRVLTSAKRLLKSS